MLSFLAAFLLQPPALIDQTHCTGTGQAARDLHPIGSGPLRLATVYCHQGDAVRHGFFDPFISPDGHQVASLSEFQPRGRLTLLPLSSRTATANVETNAGTFMRFSVPGGRPFVQWSDDSRFVWAARHRGEPAPGGWVTSPLQPIRVFPDGRVASLPPLDHAAGSLDGLLWAGGNGLALAKFGTQGGFYRPERPNPAPTMAIVDAARGRVLQSVLLEQLLSLAGRPVTSASYASVRSAYAVQLPNGRVRALLDVRDNWVLWDQGRAPRLVRNLQAASRWGSHGFDGRRLLVMTAPMAAAEARVGFRDRQVFRDRDRFVGQVDLQHRIGRFGDGSPPPLRVLTARDEPRALSVTLLMCLAFTWLNPHVYLDTVVLLGSVSTRYGDHRIAFALGAMTASCLFFFSLGYGARLARPLFADPKAWRFLDAGIGITMAALATKLVLES